ncbi:MAG: SulP family inorganic anion transporter, partial [Nitrospinales bacterium]
LIGDFVHIPSAFSHMIPNVAIVAAVAIAIVIIHPYIKVGFVKMIPAPMWVLMATIPLGKTLGLGTPGKYTFGDQEFVQQYLVQLPPSIMDGVVFPKFDLIGTGAFWAAVMTIALVTAIESMLSEVAVDTLDPYQRRTDLNKGLFSNGVGAVGGALFGAIPMISEIVRSSANVSNGAMTQWSNFWHGCFLLLFLLVGKPLIDMIPNAALAGILITVGFKLAAPKEFAHVLEIGKAQLFLFVLTMVAVLCSDLLIGVATGIIAKLVIHLYYGTPVLNAFKPEIECSSTGNGEFIKIRESAIFSNYLGIKGYILKLDKDKAKTITLDFGEVKLIDHSVMAALEGLKKLLAETGQTLEMINMDHLTPVTEHPLAARIGI